MQKHVMRSKDKGVRSIVGVMNTVSKEQIWKRRCSGHKIYPKNLKWVYQQKADSCLAQIKQA
eukprot:16440332-Heterocapsa_arctica.AAC.1